MRGDGGRGRRVVIVVELVVVGGDGETGAREVEMQVKREVRRAVGMIHYHRILAWCTCAV